jgi:ABC-type multidrug transport system ATPase subunit
MLRDPAILILDEATSAIDAQSEQLIYQALRDFARGRTTFIITHAVTQNCLEVLSRIVVMEQGRVAAAGTHAELLEACPAYQRLYRAQGRTREQEPPAICVEGLPSMRVIREDRPEQPSPGKPRTVATRASLEEFAQVESPRVTAPTAEAGPRILPLRRAAGDAPAPQACDGRDQPGHSNERAV